MNRRLLVVGCAAAALLSWPPARVDCFGSAGDTGFEEVQKLNEVFVATAEKILPTVVVITVVQKVPPPTEEEEDSGFSGVPPGFWRKFHDQFRRPETTRGEGSGILVRENGYILTNRHVVEDAESIEVRLQDGRRFKAVLHGADPQSDLAVIKIEAQGLPVARFADSSKVRVGEFAIAVGAPFSLESSVTFGHVSAANRSNIIEGSEGASMDQDFLQTDALINPGNSGGPLVNLYGEVIGVNTLIRGLRTGIGFAIPSSLAKEVADQLIEHGKFTRAWLGIGIQALRDQPEMRQFAKGLEDGVVVSSILPEGPAAKSELKASDIITAVDGRKVATPQQLRTAVRSKRIGQPVTLDVFRTGKTVQVKLTPGEWVQPDNPPLAEAPGTNPPKAAPTSLGLTVQELTRELAKRFGANTPAEGVLVSAVDQNSPAARKGLRSGDIITSVNQQVVTSKKQFDAAVKKTDLTQGVLINVLSEKTARFVILKSTEP
jgi:serine protease Do